MPERVAPTTTTLHNWTPTTHAAYQYGGEQAQLERRDCGAAHQFRGRRAERDWAAARRRRPQLRSRRGVAGRSDAVLCRRGNRGLARRSWKQHNARRRPPRTAAAAAGGAAWGDHSKARGSVENEEHQYSMSRSVTVTTSRCTAHYEHVRPVRRLDRRAGGALSSSAATTWRRTA